MSRAARTVPLSPVSSPASAKAAPTPRLAIILRPARWRQPGPRVLAWLGLVGIAEFLIAILVLHLTSLRQEPEHMSQFANTRFWMLWNLAIYSFTVGGAALSLAIRPHLGRSLFQRMGVWMLWLSVVGAVLLTAFPMDGGYKAPTVAGAIHGGAAFSMFMLLGIAMVVLAPAFRSNPAGRSFSLPSVVIGGLVSACGVTYLVATLGGMELAAFAQRFMVALIATWFVLLALRLLGAPARARAAATVVRPRTAQGRFAPYPTSR